MTVTAEQHEKYVGQSILRREDAALTTGRGTFTDGIVVPGTLHLAVLRSPLAHARITSVDLTAARALPGVVAAGPTWRRSSRSGCPAAGRSPRTSGSRTTHRWPWTRSTTSATAWPSCSPSTRPPRRTRSG